MKEKEGGGTIICFWENQETWGLAKRRQKYKGIQAKIARSAEKSKGPMLSTHYKVEYARYYCQGTRRVEHRRPSLRYNFDSCS